jgi:hypothetical protein
VARERLVRRRRRVSRRVESVGKLRRRKEAVERTGLMGRVQAQCTMTSLLEVDILVVRYGWLVWGSYRRSGWALERRFNIGAYIFIVCSR